jgi:hypothetical protein
VFGFGGPKGKIDVFSKAGKKRDKD